MDLTIGRPYRVTGYRLLPDRTSNTFSEVFERLIYKGIVGGHEPTDNPTALGLTVSGPVPFEVTVRTFEFPPGTLDVDTDPKIKFRVGKFEAEESPD